MIQPVPYLYINTPDALERAIGSLAHTAVIGVDTEGDSLHSYQEKVSLIQVSGNGKNLIIDPLALKDLSPLGNLLSRPDILKVLHGTDYDVVVLKRDFGFKISPVFDTCLAARACGIQKFSLADLLHQFFGLKVDKKHQKANWSARPLSRELLEYAALDTHYLPELYHRLKTDLVTRGRLEMIEEECRLLSQREWTGKSFEPNDYLKMKGAAKLSQQCQRVARALAVGRDQLAKELDRPAFKVLSDQDLLRLAIEQPATEQGLAELFPKATHSIRRRGNYWLAAIRQGREDLSPLPSLPTPPRHHPLSQTQQDLVQKLKLWRDTRAKGEGVEPSMVFSNQDLRQLVQACSSNRKAWPKTPEDLSRMSFIRQWQIKRYGKDLLAYLTENDTVTESR